MSTKAQIKANQQNAQKSTGPQTDEGKAVVSQNAVKHGLFAAESVISGEDPAGYEDFHEKFLADLAPVGMAESVLAERVISLSWRLRRAVRMQNQSIDVMIALAETDSWQKMHREKTLDSQDPRAGGLDLLLGWATRYDFSNSRVLDRLLLYERRIENSMVRMMKELKRFQVMRRIELQNVEKQIEPSTSLRDEDATQSTPARAIPIPINDNRDEAATRRAPAYKMDDLKKQSQSAAVHDITKSCMQGVYDDNLACGAEENKANSSGQSMPERNCRTDQSQSQALGSDSVFEFEENRLKRK